MLFLFLDQKKGRCNDMKPADNASSDHHLVSSLAARGRKVLTGVMSVALVLSAVMGGGVSTAFAQTIRQDSSSGGSTATVTLTDAEHGSMSFEGTADRTKTVSVGDTVKVSVKGDDGYTTSSVGVVDSDGNVSTVTVDDGVASFKVTRDVNVVAGFYAVTGGDQNTQAFESLTTDGKGAKVESTKDYILKHMNTKYTGKGKKLTAGDVMGDTVSVADGTQASDATLDKLFGAESDKDGDGYSDDSSTLVNQTFVYVPLYSASDDGDYFVGRVAPDMSGAKVTDWAAAENNADGKTFDDIIFDSATGLVYVPKSHVKTDKDGKKVAMSTRIQLLYTTDGDPAKAVVKVPVEVNASGVTGKVMGSGDADASAITVGTVVKLAQDDKAKGAIKSDTIDSVSINGIDYTSDMNAWTYDESTGELTINVSPIAITDIKVNLSESFTKGAYRFFEGVMGTIMPDAFAAQSYVGSFKFNSTPGAGQNIIVTSRNIYKVGGIGGYTSPMIDTSMDTGWGHGNYETKVIWEALGNMYVDANKLNTAANSIERSASVPAQTVDGIDIPAMNVNLMCSHVNVGVGDDPVHSGYDSDLDYVGRANIHIIAVQGNEIVFGLVVPTSHKQAGGGFFRAKWELRGGWVSLKKVSEKPEYTNGNSAYDLTGAQYGIFTDRACTNRVATVSVQNNGGQTNEAFLQQGTYYAKEISSAKGYKVNGNVREVNVTSGEHHSYTLDGNMAEPVITDPMALLVQKGVTGWDEAGKPMGDQTTFAGIKFRVDYYNNLYNSVADAQKAKPTASAVFETNERGGLFFSNAKPVDGTSWPYKSDMGVNVIPLGTVVMTEVSAVDGLKVMGAKAFTMTDSGDHQHAAHHQLDTWSSQTTEDGTVGAISDDAWRGGLSVSKADGDSSTQTPQGDASLLGITYTVYNESKNAVAVYPAKDYEYTLVTDGKEALKSGAYEYAPGEAIMTITTQETGENKLPVATTGNGVLPYGTYKVVETEANTSYNNADWSKTFEIRSDEQMVAFGSAAEKWNENAVQRGGMLVVKADADTGKSSPQGDAVLENTSYDLYNRSKESVYVNGTWYKPGAKIMTLQTEYDGTRDAWIATTGENVLPYGTYEITETGAPVGYHKADWSKKFTVRSQGQMVELADAKSGYNTDDVMRGGVSVTKADADWHKSDSQGDATLKGTVYDIVNKSANPVYVNGELHDVDSVVMSISTKWDDESQSWVASTAKDALPYGTYQLVERKASEGYNNANWTQTFTVRQEGEMHYFDNKPDTGDNDYAFHAGWNENAVQRGGVTVGKVDRETGKYISLGEAHLDGAVFAIVNKSAHAVYVNGKTYEPGDEIMTIASEAVERDGRTIYAATTGESVLPYGTYELHEVKSGTGYLFDSTSKAYTKTFTVRSQGQMVDLTDEADAVANQVSREDWHFQKKAEDSMERMDHIAFLVTSQTTGEKHVIVTDENGTWGSAWVDHSQNTNANDPTAPNTNGAMGVDENGDWYVKDSSKLDFDSGVWFTGMSSDRTQWADDGQSYTVDGKTVSVNDKLRAFPYDTYTVQELRCDNNVGYKLVSFTVTLHRYTKDHDGAGLDIDYGTIDDKAVGVTTLLSYNVLDKVAPTVKAVTLNDRVLYTNLDANTDYTMAGELHLVNADGTDGGVIATSETPFNSGAGIGLTNVTFDIDSSKLGGRAVVAFEYIMKDGKKVAEHADITDKGQTVTFPKIGTTLTGDAGHTANGSADTIKLTDKVTYQGLEVGKTYTMTGTLMDKKTGKAVTGADGKPITAQTTFAPTAVAGTVDVTFTFSGVDLSGKSVVAFESASRDGVEYATHADIDDKDQTVAFPSLDSKATDAVDDNHEIASDADQSISEKLTFTNLDENADYHVTGELHLVNADGTDAGVLTDKGGKAIQTESGTFKGADALKDGIELTFKGVDASSLGGRDVVVFDTLYGETGDSSVVLGVHANAADKDQTVHVPAIKTTAKTSQGLSEIQVPSGDDKTVILTDTVAYENLTSGREYTMSGELHLVSYDSDGKVYDGNVVKGAVAKTTFTPKSASGTVDVTFKFDASALKGQTVVAFESVARNDEVKQTVAKHADVTDEGQSIHFVDMGTTMTADNGKHETQVASGEQPIHLTDTVEYSNLVPGREYTLTGTLHKQDVDGDGNVTDGGEVVDADGNTVTSTIAFTPTEASGKVDVTFDFMGKDMDGKTLVAFESMGRNGQTFATHADITDEGQSTHFIKIGTTAKGANGIHEVQAPTNGKDTTVTDTVELKNLIVGHEYTLMGTLHKQAVNEDGSISDGGALKDADGNPVITTTTFKADAADTTAELTFKFDAEDIAGTSVVAFEDLSYDGVIVATHSDASDEGQTVHFVDLDTTLTDNGLHETQVPSGDDKTVSMVDTVAYKNLIVGHEYTVTGTLHVKGEGLMGDVKDGGTIASATTTFKPETADGTVDVKFDGVDVSALDGKDVVAFEDLSYDKVTVATHENLEDEGQTVHFVKVQTEALDKTTGNHMTAKGESVTIVDTVTYDNLVPGNVYDVTGTLHVQKVADDGTVTDGGTLKDADGKDVTATAQFTAEKVSGTVDVTFTFVPKAGELDGQTVVAFEDLSRDGVKFASHADITDEAQSVHTMGIGTTLTGADKKSKDIQSADKVDVVDTIAYENLVPGEEYTAVGYLVDKDGNALNQEAKVTFKADKATGTVDVVMTFDASKLKDGDKVVAFERVLSGDKVIGSHEDLSDEGQTVTVKASSTTPTDHVSLQTGIDNYGLLFAVGMLAIAALGAAYVIYRRRKLEA